MALYHYKASIKGPDELVSYHFVLIQECRHVVVGDLVLLPFVVLLVCIFLLKNQHFFFPVIEARFPCVEKGFFVRIPRR